MAANIQPIFPKAPNVSWGTVLTANTAKDGTGAVITVFTAGSEGSRVDAIKVRPTGTAVATVLRIFINNGSANTTAANNVLFHEVAMPATTITEVAAQGDTVLIFDGISLPQLVLKPGYKINITIGTTVAAGLQVIATGGDY